MEKPTSWRCATEECKGGGDFGDRLTFFKHVCYGGHGTGRPIDRSSASSTGMPSDESMVWKMPMVSALELSLEEFETLPLEELGDSLSPLLILAEGRSEEPHVTIWCAAQAMCEVESDFMEAPLIDGIQWFLANGNC
jgi:hypothetical protein